MVGANTNRCTSAAASRPLRIRATVCNVNITDRPAKTRCGGNTRVTYSRHSGAEMPNAAARKA